jgi:hypothetical protein
MARWHGCLHCLDVGDYPPLLEVRPNFSFGLQILRIPNLFLGSIQAHW